MTPSLLADSIASVSVDLGKRIMGLSSRKAGLDTASTEAKVRIAARKLESNIFTIVYYRKLGCPELSFHRLNIKAFPMPLSS